MFETLHKAGSLSEALACFSKQKLNLTRIESRPSKHEPWQYCFFVDIEGHKDDVVMGKALAELEKIVKYFKVLGSYPF